MRKIVSHEDLESFQEIVRLLVQYTEKMSSEDQLVKEHFERKSICKQNVQDLIVFIKDVSSIEEPYLYHVNVEVNSSEDNFSTEWLHEDGIMIERATYNEDHPVHKITCLTDIFRRASEVQDG